MLRITPVESGNGHVSLRLEGRIAGPWVAELWKACEKLLSEGRALKLDLADVTFVDQNGTALLKTFRGRGVRLDEVQPFVVEQLKVT